jgi:hypothetical protein
VSGSPGAGKVLKTKNTNAVWHGLKRKSRYTFTVEAYDPTDKIASGYVPPVSATTK